MISTGIIRRIDDIGRVVIPKEIRHALKIKEGDPLEIYIEQDGSVILKPYHKSWEQYAIDFYKTHPHIFRNSDAYIFHHQGLYTVCFINAEYNGSSRYGVAKRHPKDNHDYRIGEVAAYANAIGKSVNELIGFKED